MLKLWGGGHFDGHQWRCIIVPPNLARSYGAIYAHFPCFGVLLYHNLNAGVILSPSEKGNTRLTKLLGRLIYEKIRRHNNSPSYVKAIWPLEQIPPLMSLTGGNIDLSYVSRVYGRKGQFPCLVLSLKDRP